MNRITYDIETYPFAFIIQALVNGTEKHTYVAKKFIEVEKIRQFVMSFSKFDYVVDYNGSAFDLRVLSWIAGSKHPFMDVGHVSSEASKLISDMNKNRKNRKNGVSKFVKTSAIWDMDRRLYDNCRANHFDVFTCYTIDKDKSLKHWEMYRGWSIKESSVAFNAKTASDEEIDDCVEYCLHDVEATDRLFMEPACQELLEVRSWLRSQCTVKTTPDLPPANLSEIFAYGDTMVDELTTVYGYIDWDEFNIPDEVKDLFKQLALTGKNFEWHGISFGKGGVHYARRGRNDGVHIEDVVSMYPHCFIYNTQLKTPDATQRMKAALDKRLVLKHLKHTDPTKYSKAQDLGLKLVLNGISGKFRQPDALAYQPAAGLAMCIIGQMACLEATLYSVEDRFEDIVEMNTDSFAVIGERSIARSKEYCKNVHHHFSFEGEEFPISYWKDVNNYVVFNADMTLKETHGDDSSDLIKKKNEPVVVRSLFKNLIFAEGAKPVLDQSDVMEDYVVKYHKSASAKNATIDGKPMKFNNYYFMWVTAECPDAKRIEFSSDRIDKANGLIKSRLGVYAFDIEDLRKNFKYVDRNQYKEDLKQLLYVWGRHDMCSEYSEKLSRAKVIARNKALREAKSYAEIKAIMNRTYNITYRI